MRGVAIVMLLVLALLAVGFDLGLAAASHRQQPTRTTYSLEYVWPVGVHLPAALSC